MGRSDFEKAMIQRFKDAGFPYTAAYIEKFGDHLNPWFSDGKPFDEKKEAFYKKCVEEGYPWNYYVDEPEGDEIL